MFSLTRVVSQAQLMIFKCLRAETTSLACPMGFRTRAAMTSPRALKDWLILIACEVLGRAADVVSHG